MSKNKEKYRQTLDKKGDKSHFGYKLQSIICGDYELTEDLKKQMNNFMIIR